MAKESNLFQTLPFNALKLILFIKLKSIKTINELKIFRLLCKASNEAFKQIACEEINFDQKTLSPFQNNSINFMLYQLHIKELFDKDEKPAMMNLFQKGFHVPRKLIYSTETDKNHIATLLTSLKYEIIDKKTLSAEKIELLKEYCNARDVDGNSFINLAIIYDNMNVFLELIKLPNIDLTLENFNGHNALFLISLNYDFIKALSNNYESLPKALQNEINIHKDQILLDKESCETVENYVGKEPIKIIALYIAIFKGVIDTRGLEKGYQELCNKLFDNDYNELRNTSLSKNINLKILFLNKIYNDRHKGYSTFLTHLSMSSNKNIELLLNNGADPNIQLNSGDTALVTVLAFQSFYKSTELMELLLDRGADPNIQNNHGNTVLMIVLTIYLDHMIKFLYVKLLLEHGANPNIKNRKGETALAIAQENNFKEIEELLLQYGAKVNPIEPESKQGIIIAKRKTDGDDKGQYMC